MYVLLKTALSHHRELPVSPFLYPLSHCQEKGRKVVSLSPGDSKSNMKMNSEDSGKEKCCSFPSTVAWHILVSGEMLSSLVGIFFLHETEGTCANLKLRKKKSSSR